jgi:hypothetical protein
MRRGCFEAAKEYFGEVTGTKGTNEGEVLELEREGGGRERVPLSGVGGMGVRRESGGMRGEGGEGEREGGARCGEG